MLGQSPSKIIYDKKIDLSEKANREKLYTDEKMMKLRNELIQIINKDISEKYMN